MIMYNAKDRPLPANHSFTHNVASLLASTFRSSCHVQIKLGARCLLKQTSAFGYLLQAISLWVCSPVGLDPSDQVPVGLGLWCAWNPHPRSSLRARCLPRQTSAFTRMPGFHAH